MQAKIVKIERVELPDDSPDVSWLEQDYADVEPAEEAARYREQDRERLERYGVDWWMVGVRARATVQFDMEQGGSIHGTVVESPGLWGIESDSGEEYFEEVYREQLEQLAEMLLAMGFDKADVLEHAPELMTEEKTG